MEHVETNPKPHNPNEVTYKENYKMENGLSSSDIILGSALSGGGRGGSYGGYGGGAWGGGGYSGSYTGNKVLAAEAHANGTAVGANILNNKDAIRDLGMDFENATRDRQVSDIKDTVVSGHDRIVDRITATELNSLRDKADTLVAINTAAKDAAECCCEAKLQNCKDHAEIQALVIKENSATRELIRGDALNAANARITQLETINALRDNGHGRH